MFVWLVMAMQFSRFWLVFWPAFSFVALTVGGAVNFGPMLSFRLLVLGCLQASRFFCRSERLWLLVEVGHPGLEPGTSPLSGVRSNHLS